MKGNLVNCKFIFVAYLNSVVFSLQISLIVISDFSFMCFFKEIKRQWWIFSFRILIYKLDDRNLKWNCWPADAKFGYHLNPFFRLLTFMKNIVLLVCHPNDILLFAPNNLLELLNNCCCILRFFNYPYFLLGLLIIMLFRQLSTRSALFLFFPWFSEFFYGFTTHFQILHLNLKKMKRLWNEN